MTPAVTTDLRAAVSRPAGRDHVEEVVDGAAALTDRGLVRRRNEDAYAVVTHGGDTFAVVCDGVASVPGGAEASLAACEAAAAVAARGLAEGDDPQELAAASARAAFDAVADLPAEDADDGPARRDGPPACTYVAALVRSDGIVVSWVGDSRAYWLADHGGPDGGEDLADAEPRDADGRDADPQDVSRVVTTDDSWAAEMVAAGLRDADSAWSDRRAHVITRWLAADAPGHPARAVTLHPTRPGVLLLCSDGLWNHLPDADDLAALRPHDHGREGLADAARAMVGAALDDGGHDNTTVVLVAADPTENGVAGGRETR